MLVIATKAVANVSRHKAKIDPSNISLFSLSSYVMKSWYIGLSSGWDALLSSITFISSSIYVVTSLVSALKVSS